MSRFDAEKKASEQILNNSWKRDLDSFFSPQSVAVIGASDSPGSRGDEFMDKLTRFGFKGRIYPVNPGREQVFGLRCYKSVGDIGEEIDFAAVAVPNAVVPKILEECANASVKSGVIVAAGFGESAWNPNGTQLLDAIRKTCEDNRLRICGPNCLGVINATENFFAFSTNVPEGMRLGNVGVVFQSGGMSTALMRRMTERGVGLSHLVTSGNESILASADYMNYLVQRPEVKLLAVFMEGVKEPEELVEAFRRARELRKPIILFKAGRTEVGGQIASFYTGSMVGAYDVFRDVLRQNAVIEVDSLDELIEHLALFSKMVIDGPQVDGGAAFVTLSGATAAVVGDLSQRYGLTLAKLSASTKSVLGGILPVYAHPSNPLDMPGTETFSLLPQILSTISSDAAVNNVVLVYGPLTQTNGKPTHDNLKSVLSSKRDISRPFVILCETAGGVDPKFMDLIGDTPLVQGMVPGIKAIKNYVADRGPHPLDARTVQSSNLVERKLGTGGAVTLSQGLGMLEEYGISAPSWRLVEDLPSLIASAKEIGYPLVIKPDSGEVIHKSDLGLVRTNIGDEHQLVAEYHNLLGTLATHTDDKKVVLQKMISGGTELALGYKNDPTFGPTVMLALGGIFIEVKKEKAIRLPPLTASDVSDMVQELDMGRVIGGVRGKSPVDMESLTNACISFSQMVLEYADWLDEADVNPLIASNNQVLAVDVRLLQKNSQR